jgi:alkanesulfonate monooxygenase SsuD/methylene tetrahydromethanopterin reductase-like flavin-dependent oxidoreductase (luciferase family)
MNNEKVEFGVFDHLDRTGPSLADYYEDRLTIAEAYDRAGFYGYHLAEHHATPLGMAPSPNVFLAALAQRTRRLRLLEEICMLDQISGGRLEIGFGRGASPIELAMYGEDPDAAQEIYTEGLELILKALTVKRLDFHGKHFSFDDVPIMLEPLQKPYPPIWYGVHAPDSAERAAKRNLHVVSLDPPGDTRLSIERYRATWRPPHPGAALPKLGLGRFIVVGETDAAAIKLARRAYLIWHQSFTYLFRLRDHPQVHPRPADFDALMERGQGVAGSPATVTDFLKRQLAETQCNYVVGQFAFGDMTREEALGSIGLFVSNVMPAMLAANDETLVTAAR